MRKISFLILLFFCMIPFALAKDLAEEDSLAGPVRAAQGELVNTNMAQVLSRLDGLERRFAAIERDKRSQDDRIRSMERDISDLRRRRI